MYVWGNQLFDRAEYKWSFGHLFVCKQSFYEIPNDFPFNCTHFSQDKTTILDLTRANEVDPAAHFREFLVR